MKNAVKFFRLILITFASVLFSCNSDQPEKLEIKHLQEGVEVSNFYEGALVSKDTFPSYFRLLGVDTTSGEQARVAVVWKGDVYGLWLFNSSSFLCTYRALHGIVHGPGYEVVVFSNKKLGDYMKDVPDSSFAYQVYANGQCSMLSVPENFSGEKNNFWQYFANWADWNAELGLWDDTFGTGMISDEKLGKWIPAKDVVPMKQDTVWLLTQNDDLCVISTKTFEGYLNNTGVELVQMISGSDSIATVVVEKKNEYLVFKGSKILWGAGGRELFYYIRNTKNSVDADRSYATVVDSKETRFVYPDSITTFPGQHACPPSNGKAILLEDITNIVGKSRWKLVEWPNGKVIQKDIFWGRYDYQTKMFYGTLDRDNDIPFQVQM